MLARIARPLYRARPRLSVSGSRAFSYPKEGVFQPNSPRREIPGFGPAPPMNPYQQQPFPPQQYPGQQFDLPNGPPTPSRRRFVPRWYTIVIGLFFFGVGFYNTHVYLDLLSPLEPGSEEDKEELSLLFEELENYTIIKQLRNETTKTVDGSEKHCWREWTAYAGFPFGQRSRRLTTGPLAGSAGVAAQRVFWNEDLQQIFLFINFGPAVTGWPDVVHGGCISTICDETLGRVAIKSTEANTAVTANLEVQFLDKCVPGQWYLLVAGIDAEKEKECTDRKKYVQGVLVCVNEDLPHKDEDTLIDAHPHCVAKALFVVPKTTQLRSIPEDF